ncbi:hypothetical protein HRR83_007848 [Exophiala dermatitidis]|uniref:Uncharacterized protein n=1 Tax=Exophiala dermatitidis TaxID=5970 RepID=A0AAN6ES08_EXODE|nr:hypothetical protein HRR75_006870 [Exophiala dermatitidis]KAJ4508904.1 hypothetical protein HRR74_007496 [Exophiala dermatitidis]KAJ4510156.1 hypothetical protein HRR73_006954 [Exophiala dermatitidis]KAJ4539162.1 hypothetical protein HRR77_006575 [Exophiala dermatitidis]KAJ4540559.1 hypothetical protein HRR76_003947 [Exophiala dermatitidis]
MARRRQAAMDLDDSDRDHGPTPMSPNTRKKEDLKRIMDEDLGQATADYITTSDYGPRRAPIMPIIPKSARAGTEEARIASQNSSKANLWRTFGDTDEAKITSAGVDPLAGGTDGNSHRYRTQQERLEKEKELGRAIDLNDTYDDRAFRPGGGRGGQNLFGNRKSGDSRKPAGPNPGSYKKSTRGIQDRPWPPAALKDTESFPTGPASLTAASLRAIPSTVSPLRSKKANAQSKASSTTSSKPAQARSATGNARAQNLPSRPSYIGALSADPSLFLSQATQYSGSLPQPNLQGQQENNNIPASAKPTQAGHQVAPEQHLTINCGGGRVRKVPFSLSAVPTNATVARRDLSTHTDGVSGQAALSGFSASSVKTEQLPASVNITEDLIGLGIQDEAGGVGLQDYNGVSPQVGVSDSVSQNGSLLDSPIPEGTSNNILVAGKDKVVLINGVRYVPEAQVLALKESLSETVAKPDKAADGAEAAAREITVHKTAHADPISEPEQMPAAEPAASNNISRATLRTNPFQPREPIAPENKKIPVVPSSTAVTSELLLPAKPRTFDEALVMAARNNWNMSVNASAPKQPPVEARSLSPADTKASTKPKSVVTSKTIVSKWASAAPTTNAASALTAPALMPPNPADPDHRRAPSIFGEKTASLVAPSSAAMPKIITSTSTSPKPLIGDNRAFGNRRALANAGLEEHDEPVQPPTMPLADRIDKMRMDRKFHGPGDGYKRLLVDLQSAAKRPETYGVVAPSGLIFTHNGQSAADDSDDSEL